MAARLRGLGGIVEDVHKEISRRAALSGDIKRRIEEQYLYVKAKLFELYLWPVGANKVIEQRRSGIESMLDLMNRETRNEAVKCTEEIARLKGELWRWLKEYLELRMRVRIVQGGK